MATANLTIPAGGTTIPLPSVGLLVSASALVVDGVPVAANTPTRVGTLRNSVTVESAVATTAVLTYAGAPLNAASRRPPRKRRGVATRRRWGSARVTATSILANALFVTYGFTFKVPSDSEQVELVFTNAYMVGQVETPVGNPFTIDASVFVNGVAVPLNFDGARYYAFPADNVVNASGRVPGGLPAGTYHGRVCVGVTDTNFFVPVGQLAHEYAPGVAAGDGRTAGLDRATGDLTMVATALANPGGGTNLYSPVAITGVQPSPKGACLFIGGDSIPASGNDSFFIGGYVIRGLGPDPSAGQNLDLGDFTVVNCAIGSGGFTDWSNLLNTQGRFALADYADAILLDMGTNNVGLGGPALAAAALATWKAWSIFGAPLIGTTITPMTDGTFATVAGQTVRATEAARLAHNLWMRDRAPIALDGSAPVAAGSANALRAGEAGHPLTRVWDKAAPVEVNAAGALTLSGGFWAPNRTADGTHPNQLGHTEMAAVVANDKPWLIAARVAA